MIDSWQTNNNGFLKILSPLTKKKNSHLFLERQNFLFFKEKIFKFHLPEKKQQPPGKNLKKKIWKLKTKNWNRNFQGCVSRETFFLLMNSKKTTTTTTTQKNGKGRDRMVKVISTTTTTMIKKNLAGFRRGQRVWSIEIERKFNQLKWHETGTRHLSGIILFGEKMDDVGLTFEFFFLCSSPDIFLFFVRYNFFFWITIDFFFEKQEKHMRL